MAAQRLLRARRSTSARSEQFLLQPFEVNGRYPLSAAPDAVSQKPPRRRHRSRRGGICERRSRRLAPFEQAHDRAEIVDRYVIGFDGVVVETRSRG